MLTSAKELRDRLSAFLADPNLEDNFRDWFAQALRDSHKSGEDVEALAHDVMWAFADYRRGLYTSAQLREELDRLSADTSDDWLGNDNAAVKTDVSSTTLQILEVFPGA
jgi:hypothetical protein